MSTEIFDYDYTDELTQEHIDIGVPKVRQGVH